MTTPVAISINEAVRLSGIGKTTIYRAISRGDLIARKLGRRTIIKTEHLHLWLDSCPELHPKEEVA